MTKEITKAIILQQMQDKLKLRDFDPAKFLFDETVIPVYSIETHLEEWSSKYIQTSITSAPTSFLFFTVPSNERWWLSTYNVIFMASGAYKVTGVFIARLNGVSIYLDMKLGQTVSYTVDLPKLVRLEPGDALYVYIDDYTSTAALRLYIDYMVEEIR